MRKTNNRAKRTHSIKCDNFTLLNIKAKTEAQRLMMEGYFQGQNIVAYGSAGSGKTFIACYLALRDLQEKKKDKIVIVRSAVPTRDLGFLPGSLEEKTIVYQVPYISIINEICQSDKAWETLTKKNLIQFITTSYIRGITITNAVVIVDEFQNFDSKELESVLTRMGENSQIILCGDTRQGDLQRKRQESGFAWLMKISNLMPDWFDAVCFMPEDIVRSEFVKKLIMATENI